MIRFSLKNVATTNMQIHFLLDFYYYCNINICEFIHNDPVFEVFI